MAAVDPGAGPRLGAGSRLGYFCPQVPAELLAAAGYLPVRLRGSRTGSRRADAHFPSSFCPHARACADEALEARPGALAGLVVTDSCNPMQCVGDFLRSRSRGLPIHRLQVPRHNHEAAVRFFTGQLRALLRELEEWCGRSVPESALEASMEAFDRTRGLLGRLGRQWGGSTWTGSALSGLLRQSQRRHRASVDAALEAILARPGRREVPGGLRLLFAGGPGLPLRFLRLAEELGARVVGDETCAAGRLPLGSAPAGAEPLERLARLYLGRPLCPRSADAGVEAERLSRLAEDRGADGVVYYRVSFCTPHGYRYPAVRDALSERGVPCLLLDADSAGGGSAQVRTRLEAFLEVLA